MNNKIILRVILFGLALLMITVSPAYSVSNSVDQSQIKTIDVSGTGLVSMAPDEAIAYLGVQTQSVNAVAAQQNNAIKMNQVIKALQDAGIAKADMTTSSYNIYPSRDRTGTTITGFTVSNQLKVAIKDINKTGDIVDRAVKAGANDVNSISFTLSDGIQQKARNQALKNAMKAARSDANIIASDLGVTITPIQVSSSSGLVSTTPLPLPLAVSNSAATPINPGDVTVSAFVSVKYQFK